MQIVLRHRPVLLAALAFFQVGVFYLGHLYGSGTRGWTSRNEQSRPQHAVETSLETSIRRARLSTYLLIVVMSSPDDAAARQAVRDTWLSMSTENEATMRYAFAIGVKDVSDETRERLNDENVEHRDILLIERLVDSYQNLAKKTAYTIKSAVDYYDFKYLLKTDTDSYVRVGHLLKALRDIDHPMLYWGFLDGRAKPFRQGKWREPSYFVCDRYLPYQLGGGYVLSNALSTFISQNVDILRYYRSEDVSVGVWLAGLQVKYVHDPRFDTEWTSRGCNNLYLITHKHSRAELERYASNIRTNGQLCEREFQTRPSYIYDFSQPYVFFFQL